MSTHLRESAALCDGMGSPFTARLLERMVEDLEAGGPVADLVGDWQGPPRADAVAMRLTSALHFAVLAGRDLALAAEYPMARPEWRMDMTWPVARAFLAREHTWVVDFLRSPPQTNEPRRSIALLPGFLELAQAWDLPIDTLELGASAGLNLNWDQFVYRTADWTWNEGRSDVIIETDWRGAPPSLTVAPRIRACAGCDQSPLDVADLAQRMRLRSYVWADQADRLARFDVAADLAVAQGVRVERADAGRWVVDKLAGRARDAATVVYHSVFLQYPTSETRAAIRSAIEQAGAKATSAAPLAWLRLEPEAIFGGPRDSVRFFVDLVMWPGGERRLLAETDGHARWVKPVVRAD